MPWATPRGTQPAREVRLLPGFVVPSIHKTYTLQPCIKDLQILLLCKKTSCFQLVCVHVSRQDGTLSINPSPSWPGCHWAPAHTTFLSLSLTGFALQHSGFIYFKTGIDLSLLVQMLISSERTHGCSPEPCSPHGEQEQKMRWKYWAKVTSVWPLSKKTPQIKWLEKQQHPAGQVNSAMGDSYSCLGLRLCMLFQPDPSALSCFKSQQKMV